MSRTRKISYLLFGFIVVLVIALKAGPMLLAGLFSYMILDLAARKLNQKKRRWYARWVALFFFLVTAVSVSYMFVSFIQRMLHVVPKITVSALPRIMEVAAEYGFVLPFEDADELRKVLIVTIQENAKDITKTSGLVSKRFFYIIAGIFIAILFFFSDPDDRYSDTLFDAVRKDFNARISEFMAGFERVVGAQVVISGINTFFTTIFLYVTDMPYKTFLVPATFIVGLLPILGNVISNAFIVATALTISLKLAVFALGFLIVIHKAEYFLNSKIVGSNISAPMWQTLLGIIAGEMVMGIPGIILAPAMLYYIREEMRAIPAPRAP